MSGRDTMRQPDSAPPERGLLLVISGPSGVGKTTITRRVVERLDATFSISATTRAQTSADVEGEDYLFLAREEFERRIEAGEFLEYARVFGNCYGTPRAPVEAALAEGRRVVLEIDVQGAIQIRRSMPDAWMVFVLPPDDATLEQRLRRRARDSTDQIERRLSDAKREIEMARSSGAYDCFVVNDDLERCVLEVLDAIKREESRRARDGA